MELYQNQIVYHGTIRGIITNVAEETVNVHLEDGRYRLGAVKSIFKFHKVWTVTNEKASFDEAYSFIDKATTLKCNYLVKVVTLDEQVFCREYLASNINSLSEELADKGLAITEFVKCSNQLIKPVVQK
jgi:hypothetical protein